MLMYVVKSLFVKEHLKELKTGCSVQWLVNELDKFTDASSKEKSFKVFLTPRPLPIEVKMQLKNRILNSTSAIKLIEKYFHFQWCPIGSRNIETHYRCCSVCSMGNACDKCRKAFRKLSMSLTKDQVQYIKDLAKANNVSFDQQLALAQAGVSSIIGAEI